MRYFNLIIGLLLAGVISLLYLQNYLPVERQPRFDALERHLQKIQATSAARDQGLLEARRVFSAHEAVASAFESNQADIDEALGALQSLELSRFYEKENTAFAERQTGYVTYIEEQGDQARDFVMLHKVLSENLQLLAASTNDFLSDSTNTEIVKLALNLLNEVYYYCLIPDAVQQQKIASLTAGLRAARNSFNPNKLDAWLQKINAILSQTAELDIQLEALSTEDLFAQTQALHDAYLQSSQTQLSGHRTQRIVLLVVAMCLLAWLIYQGFAKPHALPPPRPRPREDERKQISALTGQINTLNHDYAALQTAYDHLRENQVARVQSEKMAALGHLIASVAHQINSPLGYTKSNIQLVQNLFAKTRQLLDEYTKLLVLMQAGDHESQDLQIQLEVVNVATGQFFEDNTYQELEELFGDSLYGLGRISELINNLKRFVRLDQSDIAEVDLNECLDTALAITDKLKSAGVAVDREREALPVVKCAPAHINQALLNVLNHAAYRLNENHTLSITTQVNEHHACVVFQDDGEPLADEITENLHTPFFEDDHEQETDARQLSLSIVYQIMLQHSGKFKVTPLQPDGNRLLLSLPLEQSIEPETHEPDSPTPVGG
ncbi:MAG: HAMP domain-containing sensor histidine kinase [Pseudomonadota bacterium]